MNRAVVLRSDAFGRKASEVRDLGERQVDFAAGAGVIEMLHRLDELRGKIFGVHQTQESDAGVQVGDDLVRPVFATAGQRYAAGSAILDHNP